MCTYEGEQWKEGEEEEEKTGKRKCVVVSLLRVDVLYTCAVLRGVPSWPTKWGYTGTSLRRWCVPEHFLTSGEINPNPFSTHFATVPRCRGPPPAAR